MQYKISELVEEIKLVFTGKGSRLLDSFLPLLVFLIVNQLIGLNFSLAGALIIAGVITLIRILKRESLIYAVGGLVGVLLAAVFVTLSGSDVGFYIPGLISGSVTVILCVSSILINRPLAAWSSFVTRRWPLDWYWHPRVNPAYKEVTIFWAAAFLLRLLLEFWFFNQGSAGALGVVRIFLGWPYLLVILIASYLYGSWRLGRLKGPSVEEFTIGKNPPWSGQKRGF